MTELSVEQVEEDLEVEPVVEAKVNEVKSKPKVSRKSDSKKEKSENDYVRIVELYKLIKEENKIGKGN